jgi:hypothetical protein
MPAASLVHSTFEKWTRQSEIVTLCAGKIALPLKYHLEDKQKPVYVSQDNIARLKDYQNCWSIGCEEKAQAMYQPFVSPPHPPPDAPFVFSQSLLFWAGFRKVEQDFSLLFGQITTQDVKRRWKASDESRERLEIAEDDTPSSSLLSTPSSSSSSSPSSYPPGSPLLHSPLSSSMYTFFDED